MTATTYPTHGNQDKNQDDSSLYATEEIHREAPAAETCPKCHTTTPWKASSWCPDCGYYPGVTEAVPAPEIVEQEPDPEPIEEPPLLPAWVVKSIASPTAIIVLCIVAKYIFTYYGGNRGLVALLLLAAGIVAMVAVHIRTAVDSMNENPSLGLFDLISQPIEMWRPTLRGLPRTGNRIAIGVSGLTAALSAMVIIGGIDFGAIFHREKIEEDEERPGPIASLIKFGKSFVDRVEKPEDDIDIDPDDPESMKQALNKIVPDFEEDEEMSAKDQELLPSPDKPLTCFVYGYMKDGRRDFGRILLAADVMGVGVHVAALDAADLPEHARKNLAERLKGLETDKPSVESKYFGTWVSPKIRLPISFTGWSTRGELLNPKVGRRNK